nr:hypothetical protein [Lachnospiraceae bacterium]
TAESCILMKNASDDILFRYTPENNYSYLILSSSELAEGNYTLWQNDKQLSVVSGGLNGGRGDIPDGPKPENSEITEGMKTPPEGEKPEGMKMPPEGKMPKDMKKPQNGEPPKDMEKSDHDGTGFGEASTDINIVTGGNQFIVIE